MCKEECNTCPFNFFSEEAAQVQNYGCLPEPFDIKEMYEKDGLVWGCHGTTDIEGEYETTPLKPCNGFILWMSRKGTPIKIKGKPIVDYIKWAHDMDGSYMKGLK